MNQLIAIACQIRDLIKCLPELIGPPQINVEVAAGFTPYYDCKTGAEVGYACKDEDNVRHFYGLDGVEVGTTLPEGWCSRVTNTIKPFC